MSLCDPYRAFGPPNDSMRLVSFAQQEFSGIRAILACIMPVISAFIAIYSNPFGFVTVGKARISLRKSSTGK
jgi:hypothetical protein